jgi:cytochrome P450
VQFEKREDGRTACPFDHHTPAFAKDYFSVLAELRSESPIVWSDLYGGFWVATEYNAVRKLTLNSRAMSVGHGPDRQGGIAIPVRPGTKTRPLFVPGEADGEQHDDYRRALNPHFSQQRVAEMQPQIQRHVDAAVDALLAAGSVDLIEDFSARVLTGIACEHLGLEVDDTLAFFRALALMVSYSGEANSAFDQVATSFEGAWPTVVATVKDRRENPRDDVISALAQWDSPRFTDEEIHSMTLNVCLGAADTTSSLLGQTFMYLSSHPQVVEQLRNDSSLIRPAVEEFLRLFAVTMGAGRTITQDVEVEGVTLKKGDRILLSYVAANHDPVKYPNPYDFDLVRGGGRHLSMGVGAHACLGAHLARAIAATALETFFVKVTDFTVDADAAVTNEDKNILNQWVHVPARVA